MAKKTRSVSRTLSYGPVLVSSGPLEGRIGYYDDDTFNERRKRQEAIIYFGRLYVASYSHLLPYSHLSEVTTQALIDRREALLAVITPFGESPLNGDARIEALEELNLVESVLADRLFSARLTEADASVRIFISHSSKDKQFAHWLAVDLVNAGHRVWFDEWNIKIGESIPHEIGTGLEECDCVAVVLSSNAVTSRWVENEWHAKYWDEVEQGRVRVLPLLKDECTVPTLLKTKKYADFREDYTRGLQDLLHTLARFND